MEKKKNIPEKPLGNKTQKADAQPAVVNKKSREKPVTKSAQQKVQINSSATSMVESHENQENSNKRVEKLGRSFLLILLVILFAALLPLFKLFWVPLILASCLVTMLYPFYLIICRGLGNRRGISSFVCCVLLLLGLLIPSYILVHLVTLQTIDLYETTEPKVRDLFMEGENGVLGSILKNPLVKKLRIDRIDLRSSMKDALLTLGKIGTALVNRTSSGVFSFITQIAIMLFSMFYFFLDGEKLVKKLRYLSPLRNDYEEMLLSKFLLISRATIKGTLVIGLTQGALGAITLLVFGVKTWLLWGFVMVILSIIPMVGAWFVLIPAAIAQLIIGNVWQGIGIFLICTIIVSNIDNLIRPRLVGHEAKMHDLMIFFSTIGGITVFGVLGFIVGPVITALFITVLEIYGLEYKKELNSSYTNVEM